MMCGMHWKLCMQSLILSCLFLRPWLSITVLYFVKRGRKNSATFLCWLTRLNQQFSRFHFLSLSLGHMSVCVTVLSHIAVFSAFTRRQGVNFWEFFIVLWTCREHFVSSTHLLCPGFIRQIDGLPNCVKLHSLIVHWIILFFHQQCSSLSFNEKLWKACSP